MLVRSQRPRRRRRILAAAGIVGASAAVAVTTALAAPSKRIVVQDARGDVGGALDLQRASLERASDGRLRAVLTFAAEVTPRVMLARSGPPGSGCLRIWTGTDSDPRATRPDRLVCVTARSEDRLRGGVYEVRGSAPPRRLARAAVARNASGRSIVIRFSQSSLARPQRIRFALESTRPGCARTDCIDTVPDKGATRTFRLR